MFCRSISDCVWLLKRETRVCTPTIFLSNVLQMPLPIRIRWALATSVQGMTGVITYNHISSPPEGLSSSQQPARRPSVPHSCPNLGCFGISPHPSSRLYIACSCLLSSLSLHDSLYVLLYWLPTARTSHFPLHSAPLPCTVHHSSFCLDGYLGSPRVSGHFCKAELNRSCV